ncbi:MAG: fibrobacter succinogenes major paralogous domain-containing protein [Bacteroidales bacterium]|nr:fibrobacter succinogenes major paralogous domain-containing protein [Bacteroidales bacterium]
MKNFFTSIFSILYFFTSAQSLFVDGCNGDTPGWGESLGTVSFVSNKTWTITLPNGSQTWSDAVQASNCSKKTTFNGGDSLYYHVDCRSNPRQKGDLFSWLAVSRFKDSLCPAPWRVPTKDDFILLDLALGGIGSFSPETSHRSKYLNRWGGTYGGFCDSIGALHGQKSFACYWSQSEDKVKDMGFASVFNVDGVNVRHWKFTGWSYFDPRYTVGTLYFSTSFISPQNKAPKNLGQSLRCIK